MVLLVAIFRDSAQDTSLASCKPLPPSSPRESLHQRFDLPLYSAIPSMTPAISTSSISSNQGILPVVQSSIWNVPTTTSDLPSLQDPDENNGDPALLNDSETSSIGREGSDSNNSLAADTTNESYNDDLYDWLALQGTLTQSPNLASSTSPITTLSPKLLVSPRLQVAQMAGSIKSSIGSSILTQEVVTQFNTHEYRSLETLHPLSPPPTIRISDQRPLAPSPPQSYMRPPAPFIDDTKIRSIALKDEVLTGLGLFLNSTNTSIDPPSIAPSPSPIHTLNPLKGRKRDHLEGTSKGRASTNDKRLLSPASSSQFEDAEESEGRPPLRVHRQFMKVIAEMRATSLPHADKDEDDEDSEQELEADANNQTERSKTKSVGVQDVDKSSGEKLEEWEEVSETLVEQSDTQEAQARRLRALADEILDIALLRRTLSAMLVSKCM